MIMIRLLNPFHPARKDLQLSSNCSKLRAVGI